ncbi:hypothetical protein OCU04_005118 [Sclerotinia nivalis]|uniref:Uncharacterized protein n=1 Tax=Sclerotinia nivalis TaxID=352851 RepID=A0A9X0AP99_9HELO|nr:hypothetical protein OCU04_005118 [Sclerotinia nivalis]
MSFLRNRTNFRTDIDDDDRIPGQADESVLFQTTGRTVRHSQQLVRSQILNPKLTQDRRNKARDALAAVRGAGDKLRGISLLSGLASSPVTDVVPASATPEQLATGDDLPPVSGLARADGPIANNQGPARRTRWSWMAQSPNIIADLKNFMPLQFEFPPHPERDRSNDWFQDAYAVLFDRIIVFAKDYFGFQDLEGNFNEPWAIDMPDEFYRYVELIAEPDPAVGGWDEMLTNTETRTFLIVGIIVKILEVKVFAPNLWGNTKEGEDLLHNLDRALLDSEGYSRQQLRCKSIRTLLGGASVTPNFHKDCTTLTAQILLLLGPLFDYLTLLPARPNTIIPQPTALYQSLHNIISSAAYLSLCTRISPTIMHITSLVPGSLYSPEEHTSILQPSWTLSKTIIQDRWTRDHELMEVERAQAEGYKIGYEIAGQARQQSKAGMLALQRFLDAQKKLAEHKPPGYTHRASVKIAVWPVTRRYWAGNSKPGGDMDGQSVYNVTGAGAVFYYKEIDKPVESLFDFVARKKKMIHGRYKRARDLLAVLGLLSLGVFLVLFYVVGWAGSIAWMEGVLNSITEFLKQWMEKGKEAAHSAYGCSGSPGADWLARTGEDPLGGVKDVYSKATDGIRESYDTFSSKAMEGAQGGFDIYASQKSKAAEAYDSFSPRAKEGFKEGFQKRTSKAGSTYDRVAPKAKEGVQDGFDAYSSKRSPLGGVAGDVYEKTSVNAKGAYEKTSSKARDAAGDAYETVSSYAETMAHGREE